MKTDSMLVPLFKTIDKVLFGFEEVNESKEPPKTEQVEAEEDEEKVIIRSIN